MPGKRCDFMDLTPLRFWKLVFGLAAAKTRLEFAADKIRLAVADARSVAWCGAISRAYEQR